MKSIKFLISFFLILSNNYLSAQSGYTIAPIGKNGILIKPSTKTIDRPFKGITQGFNWLRDKSNELVKNKKFEKLLSNYENVPASKIAIYWKIDYYAEPDTNGLRMGEMGLFGYGENLLEGFVDNYKTPGITTTKTNLPFTHSLFVRFEKTKDGILINEFLKNLEEIKILHTRARRLARERIEDWSKKSSENVVTIEELYPNYIGKALKRNEKISSIAKQIESTETRTEITKLNSEYESLEYEMKKSLQEYVKSQKKLARQNKLIGIGNFFISVAKVSEAFNKTSNISELEQSINSFSKQNNLLKSKVENLNSTIKNLHKQMLELNNKTIIIIENNNLNISIEHPKESPLVH